jgi:hypothetical protein
MCDKIYGQRDIITVIWGQKNHNTRYIAAL